MVLPIYVQKYFVKEGTVLTHHAVTRGHRSSYIRPIHYGAIKRGVVSFKIRPLLSNEQI